MCYEDIQIKYRTTKTAKKKKSISIILCRTSVDINCELSGKAEINLYKKDITEKHMFCKSVRPLDVHMHKKFSN